MDRRRQFQEAKNFIIYYGHGEEQKLSKYDIVIIESKGHSSDGLKIIKAKNNLAIAYISVIEIIPSDYRYSYLKAEDFLYCDGKVEINNIYGNNLVDIRSKRWQDMLMHECGRLIDGLGYDGVFLDTIGNVENHKIIKEYGNALLNESVLFVERLRSRYPEHIIIQNNAIEKLIQVTYGTIDGICWENPPVDIKRSRLWMNEIISRLNKLKEIDKLKVLVVLESSNQDDVRKLKYFEDYGYLTCFSSVNYIDI